MSQALRPIITEQGLQAVFNQSHSGLAATISSVALGDRGYQVPVNANGHASQTSLQNEIQRFAIADGERQTPEQIKLSFVAEGPENYWIREMGFYLDDGTLFAIWSHNSQALAYKADNVPLVIALELILASLPDSSIQIQQSGDSIELLMTHEMATLGTAIANLQLDQLKQAELIQETQQNVDQALPASFQGLLETQINQLEQRVKAQQQAFVGSIAPFACKAAPSGWLECKGQNVSRAVYSALFNRIGELYGKGDGSTTFSLPDLRGEFIRGFDKGRGVDKDRVFGSWQKGTLNIVDPNATAVGLANPIHSNNDKLTTNFDVGADDINLINYNSMKKAVIGGNITDLTLEGWNEGLGSTRPRNIALLYCIKV